MNQPLQIQFADDGTIPNSPLPLLVYPSAFPDDVPDLAMELEDAFSVNRWSNAWRGGVYTYHHYHTTSHEVLGVSDGSATMTFGGHYGRSFAVKKGDVIVIPAGVGHREVTASDDFTVVGAYPEGRSWDLVTGSPMERRATDRNLARVPLPTRDPLYGSSGPLTQMWPD